MIIGDYNFPARGMAINVMDIKDAFLITGLVTP
jgi:hypothetical protein